MSLILDITHKKGDAKRKGHHTQIYRVQDTPVGVTAVKLRPLCTTTLTVLV